MLTHMSRGSDTSAADFVTGSKLAIMIVSDRVPSAGSSSRLSMPSSTMLTRSLPLHSGKTFLTTLARPLVIGACGDLVVGAGGPGWLIETGRMVTVIGPAPTR